MALFDYIDPIMHNFVETENNYMDDDLASTKQLQTLMLSLFLLVLVGVYLMIWLPEISSLNTEVSIFLGWKKREGINKGESLVINNIFWIFY